MFFFKNHKLRLPNYEGGLISSTFYSNVKIGSIIEIADGYEGLIFYKEKLYLQLSSGKTILSNENLNKLIEKQSKHKKLKKRIDFDLYIVKLSDNHYYFDKNIKYTFLNGLKNNIQFKYELTFNVSSDLKFLSFMLQDRTSITKLKSLKILKSTFDDIFYTLINKYPLETINTSESYIYNFKDKFKRELLKLGINTKKLEFYIQGKKQGANIDISFDNNKNLDDNKYTYCPQCEKRINKDMNNCPYCGKSIKRSSYEIQKR